MPPSSPDADAADVEDEEEPLVVDAREEEGRLSFLESLVLASDPDDTLVLRITDDGSGLEEDDDGTCVAVSGPLVEAAGTPLDFFAAIKARDKFRDNSSAAEEPPLASDWPLAAPSLVVALLILSSISFPLLCSPLFVYVKR